MTCRTVTARGLSALATVILCVSSSLAVSALGDDVFRLSEDEWRRHVVEIEGSLGKSIRRRSPALVIESNNEHSYVVTSSWVAATFTDSIGPIAKFQLVGSPAALRLIASDELAGIAVFEVDTRLVPIPPAAIGGDVVAGDRLHELKLTNGPETRDHLVRAVGQDYCFLNLANRTTVIHGAITLESELRSVVNNPGAPFLQFGRLVAIRQNNARDEQNRLRPFLLPVQPMLAAYVRLRRQQAQAPVHVPRKPRADDFRRPDLVAIGWRPNDSKQAMSAWRADGSLIPAEEQAWLAETLGSFAIRQQNQLETLRPLVLVFRLDERLKVSHTIPVILTIPEEVEDIGEAEPARMGHLARSTIIPLKDSLPVWPAVISFQAAVPVCEPKILLTLDGPPREPLQVARGVSWYTDRERGIARGDGRLRNGGAAVLDVDLDLVTPMAPVSSEILLADGTILEEDFTTSGDSDRNIQRSVSRPLSADNPIRRIVFKQQFYRMENYDFVPVRLDLMPRPVK